jgi:sensor histidine kinase YesM
VAGNRAEYSRRYKVRIINCGKRNSNQLFLLQLKIDKSMRNAFPLQVTLDKNPIKTSDILKRVIDFAIQYKLIHVVFWIWFSSELYHTRNAELGQSFLEDLPDLVAIVSTEMLSVYFTAYFLVPRYMDKRKYGKFLAFTFLTILSTVVLYIVSLEIYTYLTLGRFFKNYMILTISHLWDTTFNTVVLAAVITYSGRYKIEEKNKSLEREKKESELNFLRAQINPHFVFNALNSINVLIDIDKEKASTALTKFSGLLRYNLYNTKDNAVLIHTELNYLHDYIEIEKLRIGRHVKVNLDMMSTTEHYRVAPFLLVPFIENAFKHVTRDKDRENYINIRIRTEDDHVDLAVENSFDPADRSAEQHGGIGLENVKRRLELLYPSAYNLDVVKNNRQYSVKLRIYAKQDELSYS